jgi:uncharacterized membrane protein YoaK (UPF0700 family)
VIGLVLALFAGVPVPSAYADVMALALAMALGLQNAAVRRLSVPDLTTTVLTMTLTGIAADTPGDPTVVGRRILAVLAMLVGAGCGALLVLRVNPASALGLTVFLMSVVTLAATLASRTPAEWHK